MQLVVNVEGRKLLYVQNEDHIIDGLISLLQDEYPELNHIVLDGFEVEVGFTATQEVEVDLDYLGLVRGSVAGDLDIVDIEEV